MLRTHLKEVYKVLSSGSSLEIQRLINSWSNRLQHFTARAGTKKCNIHNIPASPFECFEFVYNSIWRYWPLNCRISHTLASTIHVQLP